MGFVKISIKIQNKHVKTIKIIVVILKSVIT